MSRALCAVFFTLGLAAQAAERQLVEGTIALSRFGSRFEIVSAFLIQEGANFVPLRVPAGKQLTLRQVTATCSLFGSGSGTRMNFWTIRSSAETAVHHYLRMRPPASDFDASWVSTERVQVPVRAGSQPVATFQRSSSSGFANDACVGSWVGAFEDVAEPRP
jgi:hypothetical protein